MKINHTNKTIELTKTENSAASRFGSEMYNKLREVRQDNPSYTILVNKKTVHKSAYRGLDYNFMERYIATHDDENHTIMSEFNTLRGISDSDLSKVAPSASYGEIKQWFLATFPAISEYDQKISAIMDKVKKAA